jgi:hypothetical protein
VNPRHVSVDERVTDAVAWPADHRPRRGADAVFAAAYDEAVVMRIDDRPAPRRGRSELVAAAMVVVALAVGAMVVLQGRPEAPTVGTGGATDLTAIYGSGGTCRLATACPIPARPSALIVHAVPQGFVPDPRPYSADEVLAGAAYSQSDPSLPGGQRRFDLRISFLVHEFEPTMDIAGRPVRAESGELSGPVEVQRIRMQVSDHVQLTADAAGLTRGDLIDIIESTEIR